MPTKVLAGTRLSAGKVWESTRPSPPGGVRLPAGETTARSPRSARSASAISRVFPRSSGTVTSSADGEPPSGAPAVAGEIEPVAAAGLPSIAGGRSPRPFRRSSFPARSCSGPSRQTRDIRGAAASFSSLRRASARASAARCFSSASVSRLCSLRSPAARRSSAAARFVAALWIGSVAASTSAFSRLSSALAAPQRRSSRTRPRSRSGRPSQPQGGIPSRRAAVVARRDGSHPSSQAARSFSASASALRALFASSSTSASRRRRPARSARLRPQEIAWKRSSSSRACRSASASQEPAAASAVARRSVSRRARPASIASRSALRRGPSSRYACIRGSGHPLGSARLSSPRAASRASVNPTHRSGVSARARARASRPQAWSC